MLTGSFSDTVDAQILGANLTLIVLTTAKPEENAVARNPVVHSDIFTILHS